MIVIWQILLINQKTNRNRTKIWIELGLYNPILLLPSFPPSSISLSLHFENSFSRKKTVWFPGKFWIIVPVRIQRNLSVSSEDSLADHAQIVTPQNRLINFAAASEKSPRESSFSPNQSYLSSSPTRCPPMTSRYCAILTSFDLEDVRSFIIYLLRTKLLDG